MGNRKIGLCGEETWESPVSGKIPNYLKITTTLSSQHTYKPVTKMEASGVYDVEEQLFPTLLASHNVEQTQTRGKFKYRV